ncbi:MAG: hypothetical protein ACFFBP_14555 [Promethearchaeota archaeon]
MTDLEDRVDQLEKKVKRLWQYVFLLTIVFITVGFLTGIRAFELI